MDFLAIFQYAFMAIVCIGGLLGLIKVILSEKK